MTPDETFALLGKVLAFLESCGEPYQSISAATQANLIYCLAYDQVAILYDGEDIKTFIAYWRVHPEDVQKIREYQRPEDVKTGSIGYVAELGNKGVKTDLATVINEIKNNNPDVNDVMWHRRGILKRFRLQKGETRHGS